MGCVYLAMNTVNGKAYVGKTIYSLLTRKAAHESYAAKRCNTAFLRALRKYGTRAFSWSILFESSDDASLCEVEVAKIRELGTKSPSGYNMTDGGDGTAGYEFTNEVKDRISKAVKGKRHSGLHRLRIAEANRGRICTVITRKKIGKAKKGKKLGPISNEQRQIIAASNRARVWTEESRNKLREARKKK